MTWLVGPAVCLVVLALIWVAAINAYHDYLEHTAVPYVSVPEQTALLEHELGLTPHTDPDIDDACTECAHRRKYGPSR